MATTKTTPTGQDARIVEAMRGLWSGPDHDTAGAAACMRTLLEDVEHTVRVAVALIVEEDDDYEERMHRIDAILTLRTLAQTRGDAFLRSEAVIPHVLYSLGMDRGEEETEYLVRLLRALGLADVASGMVRRVGRLS